MITVLKALLESPLILFLIAEAAIIAVAVLVIITVKKHRR